MNATKVVAFQTIASRVVSYKRSRATSVVFCPYSYAKRHKQGYCTATRTNGLRAPV
jgi:hypothetical protein